MLLVWRSAGILTGFMLCVPLHYFWKLAGVRSPWPRRFLRWAGRRAGLIVRVEGNPVSGSVLYAANHVSWLDILALGGTTRAAFVAKDEVRRWPFFGWLAGLNETLYVVRHARHDAGRQADRIRETLASGRPVALFPEGTIANEAPLLPFRASLFNSLYPPIEGARMQPVAIEYGPARAAIAWVDGESTAANARRILSRRGTIPVVLTFLEPIDPAEAGHRKSLAAWAEAAVAASLGQGDPL